MEFYLTFSITISTSQFRSGWQSSRELKSQTFVQVWGTQFIIASLSSHTKVFIAMAMISGTINKRRLYTTFLPLLSLYARPCSYNRGINLGQSNPNNSSVCRPTNLFPPESDRHLKPTTNFNRCHLFEMLQILRCRRRMQGHVLLLNSAQRHF